METFKATTSTGTSRACWKKLEPESFLLTNTTSAERFFYLYIYIYDRGESTGCSIPPIKQSYGEKVIKRRRRKKHSRSTLKNRACCVDSSVVLKQLQATSVHRRSGGGGGVYTVEAEGYLGGGWVGRDTRSTETLT